jgi:hypothetical protein
VNYRPLFVQLPALAVLLTIGGCEPRTITFVANNEIRATARLSGIRHTGQGDMVTGKLNIEGSGRRLSSADLECFWLKIGARTSESIWVDALGDYLRADYPAHDGEVVVNVYWAMPDDMQLTDADLRSAMLEIRNPFQSPSCFEFTASAAT